MPYIDTKVTISLPDNKKEELKKELGKIVNNIPGKSEKFLMIGFQDNYTLYFTCDYPRWIHCLLIFRGKNYLFLSFFFFGKY